MRVQLANGESTTSSDVCQFKIGLVTSTGLLQPHVVECNVLEELNSDLMLSMPQLNGANPLINWKSRTVQVQDIILQGIDCAAQVKVELCRVQGVIRTAKQTGNEIYIFTLNPTSNASNVHMECSCLHSAICTCDDAVASTSIEKGDRTSDPCWEQLCNEFVDVFADLQDPPECTIIHDIEFHDENAQPPKPRIYRISPVELEEIKRQLEIYLEKGWIRPITSPYGVPLLFVQKSDSTLCMCIDYHA